jgi:hypothetical protein
MPRIGKPPLTLFKDLAQSQKHRYNRILNEYIENLGENWEETILREFNLIVNEQILTEEFDPSKQFVTALTPVCKENLILTDEQKEFFKDKPEEYEKLFGK